MKRKIVAEITPILVQYPFRLGFAALIVKYTVVVTAIETAAEIGLAERTHVFPSYNFIDAYFFCASVTYFHTIFFAHK
ncbi:MAG: hypothetical protein HGA41_03980 [Syntrophaceae bacterium]|nr:hypothetical protein [Syntrophaceae bacterium]